MFFSRKNIPPYNFCIALLFVIAVIKWDAAPVPRLLKTDCNLTSEGEEHKNGVIRIFKTKLAQLPDFLKWK